MSGINYSEKIPNNVNLATDRTLQRALEHWQPKFLEWWQGMGPTDFQGADVYLRTATSVDADGWVNVGRAGHGHVGLEAPGELVGAADRTEVVLELGVAGHEGVENSGEPDCLYA